MNIAIYTFNLFLISVFEGCLQFAQVHAETEKTTLIFFSKDLGGLRVNITVGTFASIEWNAVVPF